MVTSDPVNSKARLLDDPCLTGDRYFEDYMRNGTIGDLYLAIYHYKEAVKREDMKGMKGLYKIREEMKKLKPDPMIGGPNINYLNVVIEDAEGKPINCI